MRPDALFLPPQPLLDSRLSGRVVAVCRIAEPILEVDYAGGERAYIRKQPHGRLFITRDPLDAINFPTGHARSGTPRYRWEQRADLGSGVEVGFKIQE